MSQLDYALIGNCQISALLDTSARLVWCCMPRFDAPSVFSFLLGGEKAGYWECLPADVPYQSRQRYLRNTNVVQTEFYLSNGDRYDIFDFCPRYFDTEGPARPPQIVRILRPVHGNPRVRMVLRPKADYGAEEFDVSVFRNGSSYRSRETRLFFQTDIPITYVLEGRPFELNGPRYCVLGHGEPFELPLKFGCEEMFDRTIAYWRTWVKHCNIPFEYQDAVIRSALALKLHIFEDTGAIIAATTTSIPESVDGGRTWDYRYCWLRDAYFVINVLNQLGQFDEMERFIQYLHNIAITEPNADLQPVYTISGEAELTEKTLPWLEGFKGIGPVRIGNAAYSQAQYDAYGEMVLAVTPLFFDARLDKIDRERAFQNVVHLVEKAISAYRKPDCGIWEFRGQKQHYTFSKLMCWAALDRGLKIAQKIGRAEQFASWTAERDAIRQSIEERAWNPRLGYYTQMYDGDSADASNLLMSAINFHDGNDPKFRLTVEAYEKHLMEKGFVYRYRTADDFGTPRHAFTICTFWMVDALVTLGRHDVARGLFEKMLKCSNHVDLLSEDVDPQDGELWGNFPQTYSHVGIINSAFRLSKSWSDAF